MQEPEPVEVRIRREIRSKHRRHGVVALAGERAWLLVAFEGERVLEVCMRPDEFAAETIERFALAYDPNAPRLTSTGRVPAALDVAANESALKLLGECDLLLSLNDTSIHLRGTLEGHVEGVDTSKPFVVDLGSAHGRGE